MQYAAALIEYLITGLISLIWVGLFTSQYFELTAQNIKDYKEVILVCIFPIAYIMGIYVDVASSHMLRRFSNFAEYVSENLPWSEFRAKWSAKFSKAIFGRPKAEPYKRSAEILSYSPSDTIKTMESYISRDRIARGMALNSFIGGWVALFTLKGDIMLTVLNYCVVFFIVSILAWLRLRRLSKEFKTQALVQLANRNLK